MEWGKILFYGGVFLMLIGAVINHAPQLVSWLGKLPGDIKIVRPGSTIFIPITSCVVASILVSLGGWLIHRIFSGEP